MANFDARSLVRSLAPCHETEKRNGEHSEKQVLFYVTVIEGASLAKTPSSPSPTYGREYQSIVATCWPRTLFIPESYPEIEE